MGSTSHMVDKVDSMSHMAGKQGNRNRMGDKLGRVITGHRVKGLSTQFSTAIITCPILAVNKSQNIGLDYHNVTSSYPKNASLIVGMRASSRLTSH